MPNLRYAAASIATALLVGCTLNSPDQLPTPGPVTGDTQFTLLQTTDIHDHANGDGPLGTGAPGPVGSYARIAAYVNSIRANAPANMPVVLVDSGDWTMGTLYDLSIGTQPAATYFLDTLRYDCTTLGNHEFDYTPKGLAAMLATSQGKFGFKTPIVASNMALNGNADLAPFMGSAILPTYTETLATGLKIGFIGLMGQEAAADAPESAPVSFYPLSTNYATIQSLVTGLRTGQGCNVVIALDHVGTDPGGYTGEDVSLAQHVTGIDVIASGHTHNAFGADGNASHAVANGTWTTQIICAGAYSTNVSRLDLTYHPGAGNTTVNAGSASNLAMTDANLAARKVVPGLDPAASVFVGQTDASLNFGLGALLGQFFPDYSATNLAKGIYHPVGLAMQDLISNNNNAVLNPSGLGDLCADGVRNVPNAIISKSLLAAGWNGSPTSPTLAAAAGTLTQMGYDVTPYTAGVVPSGVIRGYLAGNVPITFANAYEILPLGISPDTTQSIPVGYPLMSVYLTYADLQKVCALQLLAQSNLTPSDDYVNLSGITYALDTSAGGGAYTYFKSATAAAILQITEAKAKAGSAAAGKALLGLSSLATDSGAALVGGLGTNPYATAMLALNDAPASLTQAQIGANLQALGGVAALAAADAAKGTATLNTAIFNLAIGAIGQVSAFASTDPACEGTAAALSSGQRYRVAGDLYAILMLGAVQSQYGVTITPYAAATGSATVSAANLAAAMANRINLNGPSATVQELKEWMALVLFMITPPAQGGFFTSGVIPADYASTANFTDFPTSGAAVKVRNASYPLANLGQLMTTLAGLEAAS